MNSVLITNAVIADSGSERPDGWVLVEDGRIAAVGHGELDETAIEAFDAAGGTLFPGFIDVHNHGAVGTDVNAADADGLIAVGEFLAGHGVTAWLPTLVPDADENYARVIGEIDRVMAMQAEMPIAQIVGVHYEGVFANEKMCGALRPEFFKRFTGSEVRELPRLQSGVHITTLAPEVEGGVELVKALIAAGWVVSIGHTKADVETLDAAFEAGGRHLTHFFNAMTGVHHREVGVAGWALTREDVTFDIIADGIHVDQRMVEFACRAKSPERVSLISDSVAPTGLGDGTFELWGERVTVENGRTQNERGSIAGSVITMLDAVKMAASLRFSMSEIATMASRNPARLLGRSDEMGSIAAGKRGDLVVLDTEMNVAAVFIGGRRV
ncbi:MAG: N-acetylglucosamine-6-phosphate deacetylase [Acidobacteria bacterium]|nr:N-acetylglucosamine-6-phosphate deacetylase [Acidobacteriota bacterium]